MNEFSNLKLDDLTGRCIDKVGFGQRDQATAQAEESEDFEMLARLRHDRVVGRDDKKSDIDARGAGEHVFDEPLMAWHVYNAEPKFAQIKGGEADVDGDAARFFFRQAV